ncbi:DUF4112 domain-containing protein [Sphingosinicella terrae]|jgi:hypothetical protein|uniref:DUF4112 domain-containing protein n=1 Tax=Sphingosinicella terrae TaxID=2172047 RepID=UPI000E0DBCE6|nr:DUF4112 domain-containing protein [Sphingosinicella terrae]
MAIDPDEFARAADRLPIGRDPASVRRRIEAMEGLLERAFTVPGMNRRVGVDAILGLVPVVGDVVAAAMGAWLIWEARNLGMSKFQIARMTGNLAFDTALGAIPIVGDVFDFLFRSNSRNLRIMRRWLDKHHPETRTIEGEVLHRR